MADCPVISKELVWCCLCSLRRIEGKPTKILPDPAVLSRWYHNEVVGTLIRYF